MKKISLIAWFWLGAAFVCTALGAFLTMQYQQTHQQVFQQEKEKAIQQTHQAAEQLDFFIEQLKPLVHDLAEKLSTQQLSPADIEKLIQEKPLYVSGFGVAFLPQASPKRKPYAPYYLEQDDKQVLIDIADVYDYTDPKHDWFHKPLQEARFNDPYFGEAAKTVLAEYAAPFYRTDSSGKKEVAGIVFANQSVIHLEHLLDTLFLGPTGYWFILSPQQKFLAHPNRYRVSEQQTLKQLAEERNDSTLMDAYERITKKEELFTEYSNEITNTESWLVCKPLESSNWTICGVFDKKELFADNTIFRHLLIRISFAFIGALIFLLLFAAAWITDSMVYWWFLSLGVSTLLATQVALLWYSADHYPSFARGVKAINDKQDLFQFISTQFFKKTSDERQTKQDEKKIPTEQLEFQLAHPDLIPTGIFVTHLQFLTEKQIEFVGFVWQRYIEEIHNNVERGFVLPQATKSSITQLSNKAIGNTQTILWHVQAKLDQQFMYDRYPFDVKNIQIQIWHPEVNKKLLLIPDFDAYTLLNPHALPGLSPTLHIPGWSVDSSYFGYITHDYQTSFGMYGRGPFGIYQEINRSDIPELYFNLAVKRRLIDTLVTDLLPLAVVALLLFAILATSVRQGYAVLGSCAGVFFGLVFAQVRFRSKIPSYQLVYFENLYFLMYTAIVLIVIVSLLHIFKCNVPIIQYRNNLVAKLLYWPVVLTALIIITLYYLY